MLRPVQRFVTILSCLTFVLAASSPSFGQDCAEITKFGIFDFHKVTQQSDIIDEVVHWLTTNEYLSEASARSAAASAGISIPGIPVSLNADGSYGESHQKTWSKAAAEYLQTHQESHQKLSDEFSTANPQIIAAWQSCVSQFNQFGLHTQLVQQDACSSSFSAWYRPNSASDSGPKISTLNIQGGDCDKPPQKAVPFGGFNITCRRSGRQTLIVSLNTTKGNDVRRMELAPDLPEPPKRVQSILFVQNPTPSVCKVDRGRPGNSMSYSGTCPAPGPILNVGYSCEGGGCGWCYGLRNGSRGIDADINGNVLTWYRYCEGWSPALMSYTMTYSVPQSWWVDNPNYESEHNQRQQYEDATSCIKKQNFEFQ